MKKISCVVVDDEPLAARLIENYIERTPFLEHIASFTDPITASARINDLRPDLLFLDIQMPDMNGIELAKRVPALTKIVFTTAFRDYAIDSYDVAAMDYILKPIRYEKFLRAVQKVREWYELREDTDMKHEVNASCRKEDIYLKIDGGFRRVELNSIMLVEGMKDYVKVFLEGKKHPAITHSTMKAMEDSLPSDRFMRVSRSHIVGLRHISSVDRNMCIYIGDSMAKK